MNEGLIIKYLKDLGYNYFLDTDKDYFTIAACSKSCTFTIYIQYKRITSTLSIHRTELPNELFQPPNSIQCYLGFIPKFEDQIDYLFVKKILLNISNYQ